MLKKLGILFAFIFVGIVASAQSEMRDVIYLKNGGVVKGIIIEQIPNESVKLQTSDGSTFVYKMEEVEKLSKELNDNQIKQKKLQVPRKSPVGATLLSALLPGVGELYATNAQKGWGTMVCSILCPGIITGCGYYLGYALGSPEVVYICSGLASLSYLTLWVGSMISANRLAKEVNIQNGYLSFKIGDKTSLGFRPELSYNNIMTQGGNVSPKFTTGIGLSLTF